MNQLEELTEQRQKDYEWFIKFSKWTTGFVIVTVTIVVTGVIL